jgi:hypothetical protein
MAVIAGLLSSPHMCGLVAAELSSWEPSSGFQLLFAKRRRKQQQDRKR